MVDPVDRVAQGEPETVVEWPEWPDGTFIELSIRGWVCPLLLGVRLDASGRPVSCAVTNAFGVETGWPAQSNPRRVIHEGDD